MGLPGNFRIEDLLDARKMDFRIFDSGMIAVDQHCPEGQECEQRELVPGQTTW